LKSEKYGKVRTGDNTQRIVIVPDKIPDYSHIKRKPAISYNFGINRDAGLFQQIYCPLFGLIGRFHED